MVKRTSSDIKSNLGSYYNRVDRSRITTMLRLYTQLDLVEISNKTETSLTNVEDFKLTNLLYILYKNKTRHVLEIKEMARIIMKFLFR